MLLRYKIALGVICFVGLVLLVAIGLIVRFKMRVTRIIRETPKPGYLTKAELSTIEQTLGVSFPPTTKNVKAYFTRESLDCRVDFSKDDLDIFIGAYDWISPADQEATYWIRHSSHKPLRRVFKGFFFGLEPIEWWRLSPHRVTHVARLRVPKDPGGGRHHTT